MAEARCPKCGASLEQIEDRCNCREPTRISGPIASLLEILTGGDPEAQRIVEKAVVPLAIQRRAGMGPKVHARAARPASADPQPTLAIVIELPLEMLYGQLCQLEQRLRGPAQQQEVAPYQLLYQIPRQAVAILRQLEQIPGFVPTPEIRELANLPQCARCPLRPNLRHPARHPLRYPFREHRRVNRGPMRRPNEKELTRKLHDKIADAVEAIWQILLERRTQRELTIKPWSPN